MIVLRTKLILGRIIFWLGWPLWLVILRGSERSRVALIAEDCVLLTRGTLSAGKWSLPGGGIHVGEDVAIGACRELYEELAIVLTADKVQELAIEETSNSGIRYRAHYLKARLEEQIQPLLGLEVAEARWVPLQEVTHLPHDAATSRALELLAVK